MKWTKKFWSSLSPYTRAVFIRAFKTVAQTALALLMVHDRASGVNWPDVLDAATMAGRLSVLTSVSTGIPESPLQSSATATELPLQSSEPAQELSEGSVEYSMLSESFAGQAEALSQSATGETNETEGGSDYDNG